jgi:hypothetical protein
MVKFRHLTLILCLLCSLFLRSAPVSGACNPPPVIVNQLPRMIPGWSGSLAWYNGKIYEVAAASDGQRGTDSECDSDDHTEYYPASTSIDRSDQALEIPRVV